MDKFDILKEYFGYESFRNGQQKMIDGILEGRDCLGIMPTGSGKSLCFQIPAMLLNGTTIAISPLISLMRDQINSLNQCGIPAVCINSTISEYETVEIYQKARAGAYKIIYVAPERLLNPRFLNLCNDLTIPLVAVDEAHCVSQWGQNFRPSYLDIPKFVQTAQRRPVVAAFTATATEAVKRDIIRILALQSPLTVMTGYDRPNLYFEVRKPDDKDAELLKVLKNRSGSTIVYCMTKRTTEDVHRMLLINNISAGLYHGGLSAEERSAAQEDFIFDRVNVMVATNAFGMGIDKSNVSLVIHYNMPLDLESYYQEAGRAGRDGSNARCIMLYSPSDIKMARYLIERSGSAGASEKEREKLQKCAVTRLHSIIDYCKSKKCLRANILNYFGENTKSSCGNCSNCIKGEKLEDITIEAQKILSCIFRVNQNELNADIGEICKILHGDAADDRFRGLSTYGIMSETLLHRIGQIAQFLSTEGYFEACKPNGHCILTDKSDEFIKSGSTLMMRVKRDPGKKSDKMADIPNPELFERLSRLRKELADSLGIPAYVVFHNSSLIGMCAILPTNIDEFLRVEGVGILKAERYGRKFLSEIVEYLNTRPKSD